jgi:hypothetical protein
MCTSSPINDPSMRESTKAAESSTASIAESRRWPEERNDKTSRIYHAFQCWTYSYMGSLLQKGSRQSKDPSLNSVRITQDDLFVAPSNMQSPYLSKQFNESFSASSISSTKWKLLKTLWRLAAPTFIPAGLCELITVLCQVAIPLLVREMLSVLEEHPNAQVIDAGLPCKCCFLRPYWRTFCSSF